MSSATSSSSSSASSSDATTTGASVDPVEKLLSCIPPIIQTPLYVGVVSVGMWHVMSEHSQSSTELQSQHTSHGAYDLRVYHNPRQYSHPIPRMFSPTLARAQNVDWGERDTSVFIKVLAAKHIASSSTLASSSSSSTLKSAHVEHGKGALMVHCTIPIQQLRSSSDPLHPFPHTALHQ